MVRFPVHLLVLALALIAAPTAFTQSEEDIVSASTLTRTHTITPTWPESASDGIEGWVLLRFTVLPDGTVADVKVTQASPVGVFEESAMQALQQWKYEPVERNGKKTAQRAEIRIKYARSS